jgi:hypothetical protein
VTRISGSVRVVGAVPYGQNGQFDPRHADLMWGCRGDDTGGGIGDRALIGEPQVFDV